VLALVQDPSRIRLPTPWKQAAQRGTMAIIGPAAVRGRLTAKIARERNDWVAAMASQIVVAHAAPVGGLATQVERWRKEGRPIIVLSP
jgi:hypothetical protein